MTDDQVRVINESGALHIKLCALRSFLGTQPFMDLSEIERYLLTKQYYIMEDYYTVLSRRISKFQEVKE